MNSDKKLRICLVVPNLERYKRLWSLQLFYDELSSRDNVELSVIEYGVKGGSWFQKLCNKLSGLIYTWKSPQNYPHRFIFHHNLSKEVLNIDNVDYYFVPAVINVVPRLKETGKVCVYTDSLLCDMDQYRDYRLLKYLQTYLFRYYIRRDAKLVDLLFCQNEWSAKRYHEYCSIPQDKIYNVHFGVNLTLYEGQKDYSKHRLLIVLRKGREKLKGYTLLLKAMPLIRQKYEDVVLDVVGTDYGKRVEGVNCHYNKPREVTVELFRKATLYVMPSHNEPNGVTFLEGLACKTPIVGLKRYAFPEFCGNGAWGFIVEDETPECLAETVCLALSDPQKLQDMGIKGQNYVKNNFVWSKTCDRMLDIMKENIHA